MDQVQLVPIHPSPWPGDKIEPSSFWANTTPHHPPTLTNARCYHRKSGKGRTCFSKRRIPMIATASITTRASKNSGHHHVISRDLAAERKSKQDDGEQKNDGEGAICDAQKNKGESLPAPPPPPPTGYDCGASGAH